MTDEMILRAVLACIGAALLGWLAWLARPRPYNINGGLPAGIAAPIGLLLAGGLVVISATGWLV